MIQLEKYRHVNEINSEVNLLNLMYFIKHEYHFLDVTYIVNI